LPRRPAGREITVTDLDYTKFRLFHLSVLWRVSVASKSRPFLAVELPLEDQELLRRMLWQGHADLSGAYFFEATCLTLDGQVLHAVADAKAGREGPLRFYQLMYAGCVWTFYAAAVASPYAIQRSGSFRVAVRDALEYWKVSSRQIKRARRHRGRGAPAE
jgi:hypothetical protein